LHSRPFICLTLHIQKVCANDERVHLLFIDKRRMKFSSIVSTVVGASIVSANVQLGNDHLPADGLQRSLQDGRDVSTSGTSSQAYSPWDAEDDGCPTEYGTGRTYEADEVASHGGLVYRCTSAPMNQFCGQSGFTPGGQHSEMAWSILGSCTGTSSPTTSPDFVPLPQDGAGCPEEWKAITYEEGDYVATGGLVYVCREWPYSSHCGQAGYEPEKNPATPASWKFAWSFVGRCSVSLDSDSSSNVDQFYDELTDMGMACPGEWESTGHFKQGDMVSVTRSVSPLRQVIYICKTWPFSLHCPLFAPTDFGGDLSWTMAGRCDGTIAPTSSPVQFTGMSTYMKCRMHDTPCKCGLSGCPVANGRQNTGCNRKERTCNEAEVLVYDPSNGDYFEGDVVRVGQERFKCLAWPNSLWCPNPAYAPRGERTGSIWSDAWKVDGTVSDQGAGLNNQGNGQSPQVQMVVTKFIKLQLSKTGRMDINEIKVYDNDEKSVDTSSMVVTMSSVSDSSTLAGATDGDINTKAQSNEEASPWLKIDLGSEISVSKIEIIAENMDDVEVMFMNTDDTAIFKSGQGGLQANTPAAAGGSTTVSHYVLASSDLKPQTSSPTPSPILTKFIKLQLSKTGRMDVNEIKVYDQNAISVDPNSMVAMMSSVSDWKMAGDAIDGDINTKALSNEEPSPWLKVKLGSEISVSKIEILAPNMDDIVVEFMDKEDHIIFKSGQDAFSCFLFLSQDACTEAGGSTINRHVLVSSDLKPQTFSPSQSPTLSPTLSPTPSPTLSPTLKPQTLSPTTSPTLSPTVSPTPSPTLSPTLSPTSSPTLSPTLSPTSSPTPAPTSSPVLPGPPPISITNGAVSAVPPPPTSGGMTNKFLGIAVAIDGCTMVATFDQNNASTGGLVYVYERPDENGSWSKVQELSDPESGSGFKYFGFSIAIKGNTIVVGSYGSKSYTGAAFLFTKQNSSLPWALKTTLISSDSRDSTFYQYGSQFGRSVAIDIDENTVVVGAALTDEGAPSTYGKGAAYIYYKPSGGWTLGSTQPDHKIFPKIRQVSENFGFQVAIYKDNIVVGAHSSNKATNKGGAAYVYRKNPDNSWGTLPLVCSTIQTDLMCGTTENKVLLPLTKGGTIFARSVAMDDGVLVIGEPGGHLPPTDPQINSVYIYLQDPSTLEFPTTPSQRILGREGLNIELDDGTYVFNNGRNERFGHSVAIDGPNLVVGASRARVDTGDTTTEFGAVYLYTRNASTNVFEFGSKLSSTDDKKNDTPQLGWDVGISGPSIVGGAPYSKMEGNNFGALYMFGAPAPLSCPSVKEPVRVSRSCAFSMTESSCKFPVNELSQFSS